MDGVAFDYAVAGWWCLVDDGADGDQWSGRGGWCSGWSWSRSGGGASWARGGRLGCAWCGRGGRGGGVEIFGADDAQAGGVGARCSAGEGETGERRHEEGVGRFGLGGLAEEEADAGTIDAGRVGGRGLGDDDAWFSGCCNVRDGAELEAEAANVDGGGALALAENVGDGDLLCAEAFGDPYGPLTADGDTGCGRLGENVAGRRVGRVEAIFEGEDKAERAGLFAGVREGQAGEVWHLDLSAMDGEAHGDERGEECHDQHGQRTENDVEEAVDSGDLHCSVRIYGESSMWMVYSKGRFCFVCRYSEPTV